MSIKHIGKGTFVATAGDFELKTSKAGKDYYTGVVQYKPSDREDAVTISCFASTFGLRDGVPREGDLVIIAADITPERGGRLGLRINDCQKIGEGTFVRADDSQVVEEEEVLDF